MSERYSRVYTLPGALYCADSPVVIEAGALYKDGKTGGILGQLKFTSVADRPIKAMSVVLDCYDTAHHPVGEPIKFDYLDLETARDVPFGQKISIPIPDSTVREIRPRVTQVIFANGEAVQPEQSVWEPLPAQSTLDTVMDGGLAEQYRRDTFEEAEYEPIAFNGLWRCACGRLNRAEESRCHSCSFEKEKQFLALDRGTLCRNREAFEAEKAEEARRQEEKERLQRLREEQTAKARKARNKKIGIISAAAAVVVIALALVVTQIIIPNIWDEIAVRDTIAAGNSHTVALKEDGTVVAVGYNHDGQCDVSKWTDIVAVAAGDDHTVGLKADGTVVAVGSTRFSWRNRALSEWKNIVAVASGGGHTVGLKANRTVVATGDNDDGQCNVSEWKYIVAIAAGDYHTIGLKADGTVVATGYNKHGQCDVSKWTDIVAIAAGYKHTVGLKADGTVVSAGDNDYGQCNVSKWTDIVAIAAGDYHTVGLKADGTVVSAGDNDDGRCSVWLFGKVKLPK